MTAFIHCQGTWSVMRDDVAPSFRAFHYDPTIERFDQLGSWRIVRDDNAGFAFILATSVAGVKHVVYAAVEKRPEDASLTRGLLEDLLRQASTMDRDAGGMLRIEGDSEVSKARVVADGEW